MKRLLLLGLLVPLSGCGGSSTTTPTPTPTPTPAPTRTLLTQGSAAGVPVYADTGNVYIIAFTTTVAGTLEATVDWTFATNQVALAWAKGNCINDPNCSPIVTKNDTTKPKTISAPGLSAGAYSLVILNNGTVEESISYQIFLIH